jgi:hypothetical protein
LLYYYLKLLYHNNKKMNNKKLVAILALTGAIANLGLATAFAADSAGSQTIGCDAGGDKVLTAPATVTFEGKSTNFHNEVDASANLVASQGSLIKVTDTRGYDATAGNCGAGFTLSVASNGLQLYDVDGSDFDIQLGLGAASAAWAEDLDTAVSSPATLLANVATVADASDHSLITTSKDLITSSEAFTGDVSLELSNAVLNAVGDNTVVGNASPVSFGKRTAVTPDPELTPFDAWDYTAAIPTGSYTGTITFTMA